MRTPAIAIFRPFAAVLALAALLPLPAAARDFVQDQAGMFSASTVAQLNQHISSFNASTGKEIVVVTVPSLGGATLQSAANSAFSSQNVNGVLIFIARDDRKDIIVPDRAGAQAGWFTPDVLRGIRQSMEAQFRSENFDAGITAAVDGVLNVYRAHSSSLRTGSNGGYSRTPANAAPSNGGFHLSVFWWIIIAVVGFLILRSIMRSMSGPRYYGGAPGAPGAPGPMPGYGGYGYGGGGGGSFWSGLLGGLGGAWLGNEMFGNRGGGFAGPADAAQTPDAGGGWGGGGDSGGGWQSDAGQA
ncbi:MAG TPA: TPM domain-containing protein, partial [Candidatus Baltobacteraceae bacterium]|nr:TPM domain-containing protein [Candidatus Baltobacteraceae bacterium]